MIHIAAMTRGYAYERDALAQHQSMPECNDEAHLSNHAYVAFAASLSCGLSLNSNTRPEIAARSLSRKWVGNGRSCSTLMTCRELEERRDERECTRPPEDPGSAAICTFARRLQHFVSWLTNATMDRGCAAFAGYSSPGEFQLRPKNHEATARR